MLKLGKLMVKWQHFNPTQDRVRTDEYGRKWIRQISSKEFFGTICTVKIIENLDTQLSAGTSIADLGENTIQGIAQLHKYPYSYGVYDEFNKEVGRKLSLQHALAEINLSKAEREAIWHDYNNRKQPKSLI